MRLGLLDVVQNTLGVGIRDDATEVGGSLVANPGAQDNGLGVLLLGKLEHLVQREGAADVGIDDEEALRVALEDGIAEVVQAAGGAQGLVFPQVLELDVGEIVGGFLDEVAENRLVVVADDEDLLDLGDLCDGAEAVLYNGVSGDVEKRLR